MEDKTIKYKGRCYKLSEKVNNDLNKLYHQTGLSWNKLFEMLLDTYEKDKRS